MRFEDETRPTVKGRSICDGLCILGVNDGDLAHFLLDVFEETRLASGDKRRKSNNPKYTGARRRAIHSTNKPFFVTNADTGAGSY